jgi:hypothetical protein
MIEKVKQLARSETFIVLLLLVAACIAYGTTRIPSDVLRIDGDLRNLLIGLSANLLVAIVIFLFLERGLRALQPIKEVPKLDVPDFLRNIRGNVAEIEILETFTYIIDVHEFSVSIHRSAVNGAKVRILLTHPYSDGARQRARELGPKEFEEGMQKNLGFFYGLITRLEAEDSRNRTNYAKNVEVRLYTALPSIAMYMWVNEFGSFAYVNFFPIRQRSDVDRNLRVPMSTSLGESVQAKFAELWEGVDASKTIQLALHMRLRIHTAQRVLLAYYAYTDETRRQCYVSDLHSEALRSIGVRTDIKFTVDGLDYGATPHFISERADGAEREEALRRLQLRYVWSKEELDSNLTPNPLIIRFDGIEPVLLGT